MGKKTTSKKTTETPTTESTESTTKSRRTSTKQTKPKTTLAEKAAKAVAAVAVVGGALVAKRKRTPSRKAASEASQPLENTQPETLPASLSVPVATQPQPVGDEAIALRAYFLSERRRAAGLPSDPHQDWLDAERELSDRSSPANA